MIFRTDCNDYDLINIDDLDKYPEAFTPFCNSYNGCTDDKYDQDRGDLNDIQWGLDDALQFGGTLGSKKWSYIYDKQLTVRQLYMIPKWNIMYDLDDGTGFYTDSGLKDYCNGKLNNHWFIVRGLNDNVQNAQDTKLESKMLNQQIGIEHSQQMKDDDWIYIAFICGVLLIGLVYHRFYCQRTNIRNNFNTKINYGSV